MTGLRSSQVAALEQSLRTALGTATAPPTILSGSFVSRYVAELRAGLRPAAAKCLEALADRN